MKRIYIPTTSPQDWRQFLAEPEKQWRSGYSAKELAECWEQADGFPLDFQRLFSSNRLFPFNGLDLLLALPEYKVNLPDGKRPSQNDLFVLARASNDYLVTIMVEGKVREPFGETLEDWLKNSSSGKRERLKLLCQILGLEMEPPSHLRYQLFHRTASAILEAKRFKARYAMMIVHSFSPEHKSFEDFQNFISLYGVKCEINELVQLTTIGEVSLFTGWVSSNIQGLA